MRVTFIINCCNATPLAISSPESRSPIQAWRVGPIIENMQPKDESTHWSKGLALYAIEMRQGWFAAKGIGAGDVVEGLR